MNGRDVLWRATELIERGWMRGHMKHGDNYCAIGALRVAAFGDVRRTGGPTCPPGSRDAYMEALQLVCKQIFPVAKKVPRQKYEQTIISWNDLSARQENVLAAFREAAWVDPDFTDATPPVASVEQGTAEPVPA